MRSYRTQSSADVLLHTWRAMLMCAALLLCAGLQPLFAQGDAKEELGQGSFTKSNLEFFSSQQDAGPSRVAAKEAPNERTTRVRIAFGSDQPQVWQAEIEFRGATPSQLQSLSLDPSSIGTAWIEGNRLIVKHDQSIKQNAYDLTLTGSIDAEIVCRIQDETNAYDEASFNLHEVRRGPKSSSFGQTGRIVVERMVEDQFHIDFKQQKRIYEPLQRFQCNVEPDTESLAPGDFFDLNIELTEGRNGKTVWQAEQKRYEVPLTGLPNCPVEIPLPAKEGVYRVKLQVIRPAGFTSRFLNKGHARPLAERNFQILVLDNQKRTRAPGEWVETYSHHPTVSKADGKITEWIDWRKYGRGSEPAIVSSLAQGAEVCDNQKQVQLPPKEASGSVHWQAYPLAIKSPGKPHLVEVEFNAGTAEQLLGLTLLDSNQKGELHELGETVVHQTSRWGKAGKKQVARMLFWPSSNSPLLVLSNPSSRDVAKYGKIRVLKATGQAEAIKQERTVAIEWQDPDLASQLGSSMAVSPSKLYSYADLQTHYESAQRIADRVELAGANAAVISINHEGASLTPLEPLRGTPRYNMGVWALGVADIPRLDLLEVLLEEFDRRGLKLIPNLSLAGPLPHVERERHQQTSVGVDWQTSELAEGTQKTYNPLSPVVADAINEIGEQLITRYGKHESLQQLAIRLDPKSALLQPNQQGGFDTATVDQFLADSNLSWPKNLPRTEANHAAALLENVEALWKSWKLQKLDAFHNRLSKAYSQHAAKDYLLIPHDLKANPLLSDYKLPRLGKAPNATEMLEASGLFSLINKQNGGELALPLSVDQLDPLASNSQMVFISSVESTTKDQSEPRNTKARQLTASRYSYQLLDSAKLFTGKFDQQDLRVNCVVNNDAAVARLLASQLTTDEVATIIDSGSAAAGSTGDQASNLRRLAAATTVGISVQANSKQAIEDVSLLVSEVVQGKAPGSILTAANKTPWRQKAHITLSVPGRCLAIPVSESRYEPEWYETGQHAMTLELEPYEALSWRFSTTGIKSTGIRIKPVAIAEKQLRAGIERLKRADRMARRSYDFISNPSFEKTNETGKIIDWTLEGGIQAPNKVMAYEGEQSLFIASETGPCSATSAPFPLPETGQLAVLFHASAEQLAPDAQLHIDLITTDGSYSSRTTVRSEQLVRKTDTATKAWGELIFAVEDLPLDPNGKMQIRFTLTDQGRLNIDSLRCEDLMLPLPAYAEDLRSQKLALVQLTLMAEQALDEGRLADCQQMLDSYWARFMVTHFPQIEPTVAADNDTEEEALEANTDAEQSEDASPSIADRLRGYWPKMWR